MPLSSSPHPSPVGKQIAAAGSQWVPSHRPEQHALSVAQGLPAVAHSVPPQTPPLHASAQQSLALSQRAPSARQYWAQASELAWGAGSHRPLQQPLRVVHGAPGAAHALGGRQYPSSQRPEQHSRSAWQSIPLARHTGAPEQLSVAASRPPASGAPGAASFMAEASIAADPSIEAGPASPGFDPASVRPLEKSTLSPQAGAPITTPRVTARRARRMAQSTSTDRRSPASPSTAGPFSSGAPSRE
jgi:hypothetical protein